MKQLLHANSIHLKIIITFFAFTIVLFTNAQDTLVMIDNATSTSCDAFFTDPGGINTDYSPPAATVELDTIIHTICNPTAGDPIWAVFQQFDLYENTCTWGMSIDQLHIFNGSDINAPLIGIYENGDIEVGGGSAIISGSSGCLTFMFIRENYSFMGCGTNDGAPGWIAEITCTEPPAPQTGENCFESLPICSDADLNSFDNTVGTSVVNGPNYGCLDDPALMGMQNPQWFYFVVSEPGVIELEISQTNNFGTGIDLDFVMWGPFTDLATGCTQVMGGTAVPIQCSSDPTATETIALGSLGGGSYWYDQGVSNIDGSSIPPSGQVDEYYIVLFTNADNQAGTITVDQVGGAGGTDCSEVVPCDITSITAIPSDCDTTNNYFSVTGVIEFADQPTTGQLVIKTCEGDSITIDAPFSSPLSYTIDSLYSNGDSCSVTAYFTEIPYCNQTSLSYQNPEKCHCDPPVLTTENIQICEGESTLLSNAIISSSYPANITYYGSMTDANNATNAISSNVSIEGSFWIRAEDPEMFSCFNLYEIQVDVDTLTYTSTITEDYCGTSEGTITLNANGGTTPYNYSIDNGVSSQTNELFSNLSSGTYDVLITDSNNCQVTGSITLQAPDLLDINLTFTHPDCETGVGSISINGALPYTQYLVDYNYNSVPQTQQTFTADGTGIIEITNLPEGTYSDFSITDINGYQCTTTEATTLQLVQPAPPQISAPDDQTICEGEAITLIAQNPDNANISWNNQVTNGVPFYPEVGVETYTVTATLDGCIDSAQVTITVQETPTAEFTADKLIGCAPLEVAFTNMSTAPNNSAYTWIFGDGTTQETNGDVIHHYAEGGTYNVQLTIESPVGCSNSIQKNAYIEVIPFPIAEFTANPMITTISKPEVQFINLSKFATNYLWLFGDNGATSTEENPSHTYPNNEANDYFVDLLASNNLGCTDTTRLIIKIQDDIIFYVPNSFTPDNNGYNEIFKPIFTTGFDPQNYTLKIYNRWGEILFESHNHNVGWDGSYGNEIVPDGTYLWTIKFKESMSDKFHTKTGQFTLVK